MQIWKKLCDLWGAKFSLKVDFRLCRISCFSAANEIHYIFLYTWAVIFLLYMFHWIWRRRKRNQQFILTDIFNFRNWKSYTYSRSPSSHPRFANVDFSIGNKQKSQEAKKGIEVTATDLVRLMFLKWKYW